MPDETDIPFWKQTLPEDDTATGDDPKPGDMLTIGGHKFVWTESVRAEVSLLDSGKDLGRVYIPYDPNNKPGEDEVLAQASRHYHDMEHLRSIVSEDVVAQLAADIHSSGTASSMIALVAEGLKGGLTFTITDDDDEESTLAEREALAAEASRVFDKKLPEIINGVLELKGGPIEDFWLQFARDILATAILHARNETEDVLGGPEAAAALNDEAFERKVFAAYRNGPYITGAMLTLTPVWTETLYELVGTTMRGIAELPEGKELAGAMLKAARKSLGMDPSPVTQTPPIFTPAFSVDGYGRTSNDVVSIGARRALSADHSRWNVEAWPVFTHENSAGKALYSPSRTHFPTARDAMRAVESYGSAHVAILKYITAKHLANSNAQTRGPYGGFYMSVEEFLAFRGIKKQSAGGYRTEDRREVIELIEALEHIEVTGSVEGYEKGRRGKRSSLTIRSPLIVVSHRVMQSSTPGSEERPIAWYLRAGDWAAELDRYGPQFAVTTKALLQLNTQNDMHAFNLGNHLTEEYRIRASQQSWKQPHRVCKLLESAEIEVDRKHAGRFRERIEAALDVLTNPVDMQNTPIIESWHYADIVEAKGRGWFDRWLDSGIVINPPAGLIRPYQAIGRRKPKQPLASVKG